MSTWWRAPQWVYPPEFRIDAERADAPPVAVLLGLIDRLITEVTARTAPAPAAESAASPGSAAGAPAAAASLDQAFVIDLCNNIHRLARAAKPLVDAAGTEGSRVQRNFDLLRKALQGKGIEAVDLSGQAFSPDRYDFEPLGEPQPVQGLTRMTIVQCERPLVRLDGKMLQPAKGIVGRPADQAATV